MSKKVLCEYGCNQNAMHQFKNGKKCCSPKHNQCPSIRQKNSEKQLKNKNGFSNSKSPHNKLTENQWFQKYINKHGQDKFNNLIFLSNTSSKPLSLFCKKHQMKFNRYQIYDFINSSSGGCDMCALDEQTSKHRLGIDYFKKCFIKIHGIQKFKNLDWSEASYERKIQPIKGLICKTHKRPITSTAEVLLRKSTSVAGCDLCRIDSSTNHYLKRQYKHYNIYYQSLLEKQFLELLEDSNGSNWFSHNVQNGLLFQYFNPKKNKESIYESDFLISNEIYEIKSRYWWDKNGNDTLLEEININKLNSAAKTHQVWLILNNKKIDWNTNRRII